MSDKSESNRLRASKFSAQFRAFRRRVTVVPVDQNRWQIELDGARLSWSSPAVAKTQSFTTVHHLTCPDALAGLPWPLSTIRRPGCMRPP